MSDVVTGAVTGSDDRSADVAAAGDAAAEMFGDSLPKAEKYAQLLTSIGVERGVVGPAEMDRIWDRHLLNSGAVARLVPAKCSLVDVGSGAGLPGIVLAMLLPGATVTLLEPMARRVEFLQQTVADLQLANVEVVRGRAEDLAGQLAGDVITARAVAPLDKLAGLCLGLARPGGRVLAIKGSNADAELAKARPVLARLGVTDARIVHAASADGRATATVVAFTAPERRGSAARGRYREAHVGQGSSTPIGRSARGPVATSNRKARPNSRRGGG
ncbi:MAG TPA: 16S rRNA (guanine(527)-N(7))-methyltransferase RsmG [Streptosporangiaceae bacterium]|nr:16S rRNA (guanine(527)-N(7))-methyltransferase RsmG [Streptosporangiaceae bacterium]